MKRVSLHLLVLHNYRNKIFGGFSKIDSRGNKNKKNAMRRFYMQLRVELVLGTQAGFQRDTEDRIHQPALREDKPWRGNLSLSEITELSAVQTGAEDELVPLR